MNYTNAEVSHHSSQQDARRPKPACSQQARGLEPHASVSVRKYLPDRVENREETALEGALEHYFELIIIFNSVDTLLLAIKIESLKFKIG